MNLIDKVSAAVLPVLNINNTQATDWTTLVDLVLKWAGIAAVLIAFIFLLISGFLYLTAGGNAEQAKKGLQGILNAAIGLIIIALSWVILGALINMFSQAATTT